MADGGSAHWEWPEDCLGYKLPVVTETFDQLGMSEAIIHGCMVGLRGPKGGLVMKPWKVVTTSKLMAERMNLRCHGHHEHEPRVESLSAPASVGYPEEMADREVSAMLESKR